MAASMKSGKRRPPAVAAGDRSGAACAMPVRRDARTRPGEFGPRHRHVRLARALRRSGRAGLCPGNNESGGRRRSGRAWKGRSCMPIHIRRVLVECAHAASRTKDCQFHSHFPALRARKSCRQAFFATGPQAGPRDPCGPEEPGACTDPGTDCREIMARRNAPAPDPQDEGLRHRATRPPDRRRHNRPDASRGPPQRDRRRAKTMAARERHPGVGSESSRRRSPWRSRGQVEVCPREETFHAKTGRWKTSRPNPADRPGTQRIGP